MLVGPSYFILEREMLQFGQKSVESKDFYRTKKIIYIVDPDKIVVSKSIPCNNGKDQRYVVGYEDSEKIIPLYITTPPKVFSYGVSHYSKNSAWTMAFNVEDHKERWQKGYRKVWNTVEDQLFVTFMSEPMKEGCHLTAKVKEWKDKIKTCMGKTSHTTSAVKQLQFLKLNRSTNKVVTTTLRCMWKRQRSNQLRTVSVGP